MRIHSTGTSYNITSPCSTTWTPPRSSTELPHSPTAHFVAQSLHPPCAVCPRSGNLQRIEARSLSAQRPPSLTACLSAQCTPPCPAQSRSCYSQPRQSVDWLNGLGCAPCSRCLLVSACRIGHLSHHVGHCASRCSFAHTPPSSLVRLFALMQATR